MSKPSASLQPPGAFKLLGHEIRWYIVTLLAHSDYAVKNSFVSCVSRRICSPITCSSGLAWSQEKICSHSPSKGSLWVWCQPSTRFLLSCSRYKASSPAGGSRAFRSSGSVPAVHCSTEKMWSGLERGMREKESNPQHSGTRPAATARAGATDRWGRAPALPQSVLAASGLAVRLTEAVIAVGSSLDRRRSALSFPRAVWRAISSRAESS